MDLLQAMRTTGTCRSFAHQAVADNVVYRAIEIAAYGPQGGNRQPLRWVIVNDPTLKEALAGLYLPLWKRHYDTLSADVRARKGLAAIDRFAEAFGQHPTLVVVCAEEAALHVTDGTLGRTSVVGGASIYPLVQNFCLALRGQGVASALTTLLCEREPEVKALLGIPDGFLTAAHLAIGYPANGFPTTLKRKDPRELVFRDCFGRAMFSNERDEPCGIG